MADTLISRTLWAEQNVENFVAPAFVAEFVFRSPQIIDGTQKEVADLLILRADQALLLSQKCQNDPTSRTGEKLERWARKQAGAAVSQLKGALRRVGEPKEIWCDHRRRGRVSFTCLPKITHALAAVEVFEYVALQDNFPLEYQGTPISYLSVNDFLNVCKELRTVPEVIRYLDARRLLPKSVLLSLGSEQTLFSYYLLHDATFAGFMSLADARDLLAERRAELYSLVEAKAKRDQYSFRLEYVADQLAGRHPFYRDGLSKEMLDYYEPLGERRGYLLMQDLIAGLTLSERIELGRTFERAIGVRHRQGGKGFSHATAMVPSHPDYVFILGSFGATERFVRNELLSTFEPLARAAIAHYGRSTCFIIVDRDGKSFEVAHIKALADPTPEEIEAGQRAFGSLKIFAKALHI